jgi:ribosomal protein S18 acetylase RimI-like enzyme
VVDESARGVTLDRYRDATTGDIEQVAALHADSWRRNYRGAYDDGFLDHDVVDDRLRVWAERLGRPSDDRCTIVAERAGVVVVGFAHTLFDDDPTWGALLDNLHVTHHAQRQGIASVLLAETARRILGRGGSPTLYLWVLDQNRRAQSFYRARGGTPVEHTERDLAGGGTGGVVRVAWRDVAVLVEPGPATPATPSTGPDRLSRPGSDK